MMMFPLPVDSPNSGHPARNGWGDWCTRCEKC